jgi:hypothetical protein
MLRRWDAFIVVARASRRVFARSHDKLVASVPGLFVLDVCTKTTQPCKTYPNA